MGKSQHSSKSKCVCKKIFRKKCPLCKSLPEKSKPEEESAPPANVVAEKKKMKLEPQFTKANRTTTEAFSDYINRTKIRIRAMSKVGSEKIGSRATEDGYEHGAKKDQDHAPKDPFSDYINRAKMRIRKTSSVGSRKLISFKRESKD